MLKELEVPRKESHNIYMINKMKYKDILDIEWALRRAELAAKTEWDRLFEAYGKDELLYELAYEKVKGLREAQLKLANMKKVMEQNDIEFEYSN